MKDKKFKAVNREENYAKPDVPDIQLGRHSRQNDTPQQSTSRRMKAYQARQPTNENATINADTPYSADAEIDTSVTGRNKQSEYTADTVNIDATERPNEPDDIFHEDSAYTRPSAQHKNRTYQQHTQFAQRSADYDFTKEAHSADYSFTEQPKTDDAENTEQPDNAATLPDLIENDDDGIKRQQESTVFNPEKKKKSHKQYYHRHGPHSTKGADFDISETAKTADYSFNDTRSNKPFDRAEQKRDEAAKPPDNQKKRRVYQEKRNNSSDTRNTRKEPTEQEPNEDYNIKDSADNSDIVFERAADKEPAKESDKASAVKRKKNKRLQQKQRLHTDDTADDTNADTTKEQAASADSHSDNGANKDYQFKRTEKAEFKAQKARSKADKAEQKLPKKRKLKRQRLYDEEKQKPKTRLKFETETKPPDPYHRSKAKTAASITGSGIVRKAHSEVGKTEDDNSAVEGAHKTERAAENLARYSMRTASYIRQNRKAAPYKRAQKLRYKAERLEINAAYQKALANDPELRKSALKKFRQKQQIKKQYQRAKHAEQTAKTSKKTAQRAKDVSVRIIEFVKRHKKAFAVVLILILLVAWIISTVSSCAVMGVSGVNSIMSSSYFAEDEDIYMAEGYYTGLEANLQAEIYRIETDYPGYNEYNYSLAQIGHNPYELISYLTAKYETFTFADIEAELDALFAQQYVLTLTEEVETRTDDNSQPYDYYILNVELVNNSLNTLAETNLTEDQRELYGIYLESKGNRDYLFADDIYSNAVDPPEYTIPGEALSDTTFRTLITEAERYLGYPYVWGGSSPSTSFDCSGFVCWVFKNSGVYPLERTTAQGIYNQCSIVAREDAKPGDIIFFTGTYNAGEPVTHVGIYVGDNMMIHCGNPIQYANITSAYWTEHFYAFGRLN